MDVETVLGLIGLVIYILAILMIAASVTWVVVKLSPSKSQKELETDSAKSS